jgi:hypothetical protein
MKIKKRFIASVTETAKTLDRPLPWTRGEARAARIARRDASATKAETRQA